LKRASSKANYEDVGDEIYHLCDEKQKVQLENVGRNELKKRISDMALSCGSSPPSLLNMTSRLSDD
jgi:site-specific DNA recombinase